MRRLFLLASIVAGFLLGGCAHEPQPLYAWGSYESLLYKTYSEPGSASDAEQAALLEQDREQARAIDLGLPPGWHAHLGYLYVNLGKLDQAREEFETEKRLYPESSVFMDRLLANLTNLTKP